MSAFHGIAMFKVPLVDLSVGAIAYILPWYLFESSCPCGAENFST